jgi:glucokinase
MILAGDVGGTKVHLGLFRGAPTAPAIVREVRQATADVASLPETLAAFAKGDAIDACALGVAGPVRDGDVRGTNLPWSVRRAAVSDALGGVPVQLLNDLEASAHGIDTLRDGEVETLRAGRPTAGNRALVSPGTGLGEAILLRDGDRFLPVGSEGGHADFAPRTDEEMDLLRYLRDRWGRVAVERVLSGPGLVHVFRWLRDTGRVDDDSGIADGSGGSDVAAAVTGAALRGDSRICRETLRIWTAALGSEAGNVALRGYAVGGVFLGGGIPARILPALRDAGFLEAFSSKPPFADDLAAVPVHVILTPETTLRGAAAVALRMTA